MLILLIMLAALGVISAIIFLLQKDNKPIETGIDCSTCNGDNDKCEQTCMMEAATQPIEYYDDEELDRFSGRPSDEYNDQETEEFREVLLTMAPQEVKAWNRSLIMRGINMPDGIKDEYILLAEE